MKRIAGIIVVIAVLLTGGICISAETEGDYEYKIKNEVAIITKASETLSGVVTIPDSLGGYPVNELDSFAFSENTNIEKVVIPDSVAVIGPYAFYQCRGLEEAVLGNGVKEIGHYSFSSTTLNEIEIPESVEFIGMFAFSDSDIEKIELGKNVNEITQGAFSYMMKLESITVDEENEHFSSFGGVLFTKDKKELILFPPARDGKYNIPEGVEKLYGSAFETSSLESLILPESLVSVGDQCFVNCDIENLYVQGVVKNLRYGNLEYCDNLRYIYYNGSENEWKTMNFTSGNLPKGVTISYNTSPEEKAEVVFSENEAEVVVDTSLYEEGFVICALYEGDALKFLESKPVAEVDGFDLTGDFDKVKIFVFDSKEKLTPLCEADVW